MTDKKKVELLIKILKTRKGERALFEAAKPLLCLYRWASKHYDKDFCDEVFNQGDEK